MLGRRTFKFVTRQNWTRFGFCINIFLMGKKSWNISNSEKSNASSFFPFMPRQVTMVYFPPTFPLPNSSVSHFLFSCVSLFYRLALFKVKLVFSSPSHWDDGENTFQLVQAHPRSQYTHMCLNQQQSYPLQIHRLVSLYRINLFL